MTSTEDRVPTYGWPRGMREAAAAEYIGLSVSTLRRGETILLGDSVIMPTRIRIDRPKPTPTSDDVSFQKQWSAEPKDVDFVKVLHAWRSQEVDSRRGHLVRLVPALIADAGEQAAWRYVEFFTANIRNPSTRRAYARACVRCFAWCEDRGLTLTAIRPFDVATYIETLQQTHSAPGVKAARRGADAVRLADHRPRSCRPIPHRRCAGRSMW